MNLSWRRVTRALALVSVLTLLTAGVAVADTTVVDGDGDLPVSSALNPLNFGTVCVGQTYVDTGLIAIQRSDAATDGLRTFGNNASVALSFQAVPDDSAEITAALTDDSILMPSTWSSVALGTMSTDPAIATANPSGIVQVTLTPTSLATAPATSKSANVNVRAQGPNASGGTTLFRNATLKVNWTPVASGPACDSAAPTVTVSFPTPDGSNGWFKTSPVVGSVTATDASNVTAINCTGATRGTITGLNTTSASASLTVSTQGTSNVSCTATDGLNNTGAAAGSSNTATIKLDSVAPTLNPTVSPNPVLLNGSATASANASDATPGSGLASSSCGAVDTSSVGAKTVSCSATDNAGNTQNANASYNVVYGFSGFFSPVDNDEILNKAKAGQAIPLKWRLTDANGDPVLNLSSVKLTAAGLTCALGTSTDVLEQYATGQSGLQNLGDGYYQFNWATPKGFANSCRTAQLDLGEGDTTNPIYHTALFQFTK